MNIKKDDYVRINDNSEWKGLIGICKYAFNGIAYIFCIQMPCYLYKVSDYNKNNVSIVNINRLGRC